MGLTADVLHLRPIYVGRSSLWPWWNLTGVSAAWTIWTPDRDGSRVTVDGRVTAMRGGHVYMIAPGTSMRTAPGPDVHQVYVHLDVVGLPSGAETLLAPRPVDLGNDAMLAGQSAALHAMLADERTTSPSAGSDDPVAALAARAFAYQAFARLLVVAPSAARERLAERMRAHDPLAPALLHIEQRIAEPLYVEGLAQLCGMGRQWFARRFQRATGRSPARYVLERRVALASHHLAYGDDSIDEVASRCGFADRAHFAKAFARIRTIPPGRFRREERLRQGR
ncbi:MAG: helix-turn-helix transcriptional regulator [Planctomycetes bacterium]|nr:helix-turn-helix transcriptional regulator [Planctomycetota bacterium]